MNAMRGRIAFQKHYVQNVITDLFLFRPANSRLLTNKVVFCFEQPSPSADASSSP